MAEHRQQILTLFHRLPFYVRTKGGVAICHAGAIPELADPEKRERLFHFDHERLLARAKEKIPAEIRPYLRQQLAGQAGTSYDKLVATLLAVDSPSDPRYDNYLIGFAAQTDATFDLLWTALFTQNEQAYGPAYTAIVPAFLAALSPDFSHQQLLVTGHIPCRGGHTRVNQYQLRVASWQHASPRQAGQYLRFDTAVGATSVEALSERLESVFAKPGGRHG